MCIVGLVVMLDPSAPHAMCRTVEVYDPDLERQSSTLRAVHMVDSGRGIAGMAEVREAADHALAASFQQTRSRVLALSLIHI